MPVRCYSCCLPFVLSELRCRLVVCSYLCSHLLGSKVRAAANTWYTATQFKINTKTIVISLYFIRSNSNFEFESIQLICLLICVFAGRHFVERFYIPHITYTSSIVPCVSYAPSSHCIDRLSYLTYTHTPPLFHSFVRCRNLKISNSHSWRLWLKLN